MASADFAVSYLSSRVAGGNYYAPPRSARPGPVEVVCAGWETCRPDYAIARSGFPWLALEFVVRGEGWVEMGGARFPLRPGALFCYGPRVAHRIGTDAARPLLKYFVDVAGAEARRIAAAGPLRPGQVGQSVHPAELREIFDRLILEGNRKSSVSRAIANAYLRVLLHKAREVTPLALGRRAGRALDNFTRAKAFLDEHGLELSSLEEAARKLGVTPETLCRLFRRFAHRSPYRYLFHLKMNRAMDLLLGTDLLVKEVGERVGFEHPLHFSRCFKRFQGVSPDHFRRTRRRGPPPF